MSLQVTFLKLCLLILGDNLFFLELCHDLHVRFSLLVLIILLLSEGTQFKLYVIQLLSGLTELSVSLVVVLLQLHARTNSSL
jgi:hypothetical protein